MLPAGLLFGGLFLVLFFILVAAAFVGGFFGFFDFFLLLFGLFFFFAVDLFLLFFFVGFFHGSYTLLKLSIRVQTNIFLSLPLQPYLNRRHRLTIINCRCRTFRLTRSTLPLAPTRTFPSRLLPTAFPTARPRAHILKLPIQRRHQLVLQSHSQLLLVALTNLLPQSREEHPVVFQLGKVLLAVLVIRQLNVILAAELEAARGLDGLLDLDIFTDAADVHLAVVPLHGTVLRVVLVRVAVVLVVVGVVFVVIALVIVIVIFIILAVLFIGGVGLIFRVVFEDLIGVVFNGRVVRFLSRSLFLVLLLISFVGRFLVVLLGRVGLVVLLRVLGLQ